MVWEPFETWKPCCQEHTSSNKDTPFNPSQTVQWVGTKHSILRTFGGHSLSSQPQSCKEVGALSCYFLTPWFWVLDCAYLIKFQKHRTIFKKIIQCVEASVEANVSNIILLFTMQMHANIYIIHVHILHHYIQ